jgi:rare lipoprotein A
MMKKEIANGVFTKFTYVMHGKWLFIGLVLLGFTTQLFAQKTQEGLASYYADKFVGRKTANGERYHHAKKTAAHPKLPFGTIVKVTNLENSKRVVVHINDRGPFKQGRIIDLSRSAAEALDFLDKGLVKVRVEVVGSLDDFEKPQKLQNKNVEQEQVGVSEDRNKARKVPTALYRINVTSQQDEGFCVQLGSFRAFTSVMHLIETLPANYKQKVVLQVERHPNGEIFKVLIGPVTSRFAAEDAKSKLKPAFPGSFIVEL